MNRTGGYTRLIKFALNRQGDNAEMVLLELTERAAKEVSSDDKVEGSVKEAEIVEGKTEKKAPAKKAVKPAKAEAKKPAAKKMPKE